MGTVHASIPGPGSLAINPNNAGPSCSCVLPGCRPGPWLCWVVPSGSSWTLTSLSWGPITLDHHDLIE